MKQSYKFLKTVKYVFLACCELMIFMKCFLIYRSKWKFLVGMSYRYVRAMCVAKNHFGISKTHIGVRKSQFDAPENHWNDQFLM